MKEQSVPAICRPTRASWPATNCLLFKKTERRGRDEDPLLYLRTIFAESGAIRFFRQTQESRRSKAEERGKKGREEGEGRGRKDLKKRGKGNPSPSSLFLPPKA